MRLIFRVLVLQITISHMVSHSMHEKFYFDVDTISEKLRDNRFRWIPHPNLYSLIDIITSLSPFALHVRRKSGIKQYWRKDPTKATLRASSASQQNQWGAEAIRRVREAIERRRKRRYHSPGLCHPFSPADDNKSEYGEWGKAGWGCFPWDIIFSPVILLPLALCHLPPCPVVNVSSNQQTLLQGKCGYEARGRGDGRREKKKINHRRYFLFCRSLFFCFMMNIVGSKREKL